jgi:hypothetical protein
LVLQKDGPLYTTWRTPTQPTDHCCQVAYF